MRQAFCLFADYMSVLQRKRFCCNLTSCAYCVFNKDSGCVETTCDMVFDETNDSQVEQYDLNVVDDEEAPCEALQKMEIEDIRPQDPSEPITPNDTTPPT
jgi:hypothetical protein